MKKIFALGMCIVFLSAMCQMAVAQKWPAGGWQTAVVATDETLKADVELPLLEEPDRADVPKDALENTVARAVARLVSVASDATLNN